MALTSLPAGLFQTTSPRRHCSSLRPQAHTHTQRGLRTLRQSRRETLLSLPVKEPGLGSPGPDPKGPSGMLPLRITAGDGFLWDSYCRLPFGGADGPLSQNVENEGGFYVEIMCGRT